MNNSEMLFIYDAKLCNPNGDPDDENRPRMDYERQRNLVSDVRLKRYVRDYLEDSGYEIYVSNKDGLVSAGQRLKNVVGKNKVTKDDLPAVLERLIDVRMFGATMTIQAEGRSGQGSSITLTGPIQFNWGFSLNKTALVDSNGITSHFLSEEGNQQGAMGKDYRVYYSLIAYHGIISGKRAEYTHLTDDDIVLLDQALLKSIPLLATRSKIGQYPRLYVRVEYKDNQTFLGDFRNYIGLDRVEGLRDVSEVKLKTKALVRKLEGCIDKIEKIVWWQDENLLIDDSPNGFLDNVSDILSGKMIRL